MDAHALYPVCPHRNVPAAFERFHGPDSGGVERFLRDERTRVFDAFAALGSACERFEQRAAMAGAAGYALLAGPIQALRVLLVPSVAPLVQLYGMLARARSHWAANPQLPLLLGPQPVPAFPV